MYEGLWTVSFHASTGGQGTGVAVLYNRKVLGGDAQYTYVGTYKAVRGPAVGTEIEAELDIVRYNQSGVSVFGPLLNFSLVLKGRAAPNSIALTGHMKQQPSASISMDLTKHTDL